MADQLPIRSTGPIGQALELTSLKKDSSGPKYGTCGFRLTALGKKVPSLTLTGEAQDHVDPSPGALPLLYRSFQHQHGYLREGA